MSRQLVVVVGLCLALAGCGGAKHETPRPTKSAFRAQANRICAEAKTASGRLARVRKLRAPSGDEELFSRWLKAERDAVAATKPRNDDLPPNVDPLVALAIAEGEATGYARRLGAERCAKRTIGTMPR